MTLVSRLRLDAVLYAEAGERPKGKRGPPASKGKKQVTMTSNVFGLGEGGELEVQILIRIPMLKYSIKAPLLPNPC